MTKKLHFFLNIKPLVLMFLFGLFFFCNPSNAQVTTVFSDDFNRLTASPGGIPSMNYTLTSSSATAVISTTSQAANDFAGNPDYRLRITTGAPNTVAGAEFIMGSMTGLSGYNTVLQSNTQLLTWSFNIRNNRTTATLSGFDLGQYGIGVILACDKLSPLDPSAKGYAVVMGGVGTRNTYDLVYFQNGMSATANLTIIIAGITLIPDIRQVVSVNVTYDRITNNWNMYQRGESSAASAPFPNPYGLSSPGSGVAGLGEITDSAGFVSVSLPYFGTIFNHNTTNNTPVNFNFDNYKVTLGQLGTSNFYAAAGSDCSNLNNWWSNPDGATGTHPANFVADGQVFNIFNTGATIGSDWTVSGGGSKVVIGNGTVSNSLVISANAFLSGTVKLNANATLTISHLTVFPVFESGGVDASSTVIFDGVDAQNVPGSNYGNLSILTQGIIGAKAAGNISVLGNLNIDANSILSMDSNKLASVNILSGTGVLKTKNAFSTALPSGITWPYSVYYNYTSANSSQSIAGGDYRNLDTTGAATGSPRVFNSDFTISGSFITGLGVMSANNRITFNGTGAQSLEVNFPPATSLIIANTSSAGVTLSASEVIPDITNLELAGNLNADYNENFGTLSLIDNSVLTLGATDHFVAFTNSSASNPGPADFWAADKTLTVKGWTGTPGNSGTNGKLFVGVNETTGLTATQLGQIKFEGFSGAQILSTGEVVPSSLGINNQELIDFKYYPNPVSDKITLSNSKEISEVTVYNFLGQRVLSFKPNTLISTIDMSGLAPSVYFVEVISEGKKQTVKVIKQ